MPQRPNTRVQWSIRPMPVCTVVHKANARVYSTRYTMHPYPDPPGPPGTPSPATSSGHDVFARLLLVWTLRTLLNYLFRGFEDSTGPLFTFDKTSFWHASFCYTGVTFLLHFCQFWWFRVFSGNFMTFRVISWIFVVITWTWPILLVSWVCQNCQNTWFSVF